MPNRQLDRDLEAPDISRTLRTGYPKREFPQRDCDDVQEVSEEQFIEIVSDRKVDT